MDDLSYNTEPVIFVDLYRVTPYSRVFLICW